MDNMNKWKTIPINQVLSLDTSLEAASIHEEQMLKFRLLFQDVYITLQPQKGEFGSLNWILVQNGRAEKKWSN